MSLWSRTSFMIVVWLWVSAASVPANASPASVPPPKPPIVLMGRDGKAIEWPLLPRFAEDLYIVEFNETPVARLEPGTRLSTRSLSPPFERLEADLARLSAGVRSSRSPAPEITARFSLSLSGAGVRLPRDLVDDVRRLPYVRRVVPQPIVRALLHQSVPSIGAPEVWTTYGTRGSGVVVAVIDTGIDFRHPALGGGFGPGYKVAGGYDFVNDDSDPMDDHGHGTHVAGIIASDLPGPRGVAPDVTLLAYKVLSAQGEGTAEDVIAAVERALDPNGDGDLSDAVGVVNMSLGTSFGAPDDPVTLAVENASHAGVLFCVAAGNDGAGFSIGSPANAPAALTVGAIDRDGKVAAFSSRGPTRTDLQLKPEVSAPGVGIVSTVPGGGYEAFSGTSMATPHVTGLVALLRAIDPSRSPAVIKSAIVASARDLGSTASEQGAGGIDAMGASSASILSEPAVLTFARVALDSTTWNSTRRFRVENRGQFAETVTCRAGETAAGITLIITPSIFMLEPGASQEVELTLEVQNDELPFPDDPSLSYSGAVLIEGEQTSIRVPWNVVKAVALRLQLDSTDSPVTLALLISQDTPRSLLANVYEEPFEVLLAGGSYLLATFSQFPDRVTPARVTFHEDLSVLSDQSIVIRPQEAVHLIDARSTTEDDHMFRESFETEPDSHGLITYTSIFLPPDYGFQWLILPTFGGEMWSSPASSRLTFAVSEFFADLDDDRIYLVQHPAFEGIDHSVVLSRSARTLASRAMEIVLPDSDPEPALGLGISVSNYGNPEEAWVVTMGSYMERLSSPFWKGWLFVDEDGDPSPDLSLGLVAVGSRGTIITPPLRALRGTIVPFGSRSPDATVDSLSDGVGPLRFGGSPIRMSARFSVEKESFVVQTRTDGPLGESRMRDFVAPRCTVHDERGERLGNCGLTLPWSSAPVVNSLSAPGRYRVDVTIPSVESRVEGSLSLVSSFDTRLGDAIPPRFTGIQLFSGPELSTGIIRPGSDLTLRFAARDRVVEENGRIRYDGLSTGRSRVFYRSSSTEDWIELPVEEDGAELGDPDELGHIPAGSLFHVDLSPAAVGTDPVDLRIHVEDLTGNTTEWMLAPAFRIGTNRMRTVRPRRHGGE